MAGAVTVAWFSWKSAQEQKEAARLNAEVARLQRKTKQRVRQQLRREVAQPDIRIAA